MIRPEGKISAATSSLLTDRTGESGVLKGWISDRLPGKQGVDSHGGVDPGCLCAQAKSKIRCGSSPSTRLHPGATGERKRNYTQAGRNRLYVSTGLHLIKNSP